MNGQFLGDNKVSTLYLILLQLLVSFLIRVLTSFILTDVKPYTPLMCLKSEF